jgi:hypothetical protein
MIEIYLKKYIMSIIKKIITFYKVLYLMIYSKIKYEIYALKWKVKQEKQLLTNKTL